jgi:hypothetical protein
MIFLLAYADDVFGSYLFDHLSIYGENQHKHDWFICIKIQVNTITSVRVYNRNKLVLADKNNRRNPLELHTGSPFHQQLYRRLVTSADTFVVFQTKTVGTDMAKRLVSGILETGNSHMCHLKLDAEWVQSPAPQIQASDVIALPNNKQLSNEQYVLSPSNNQERLTLQGQNMHYSIDEQSPTIKMILDWLRLQIIEVQINPISKSSSQELLLRGRELAPLVSELQVARNQYSFDDSLEQTVNRKYLFTQHLWTKILNETQLRNT